jgi:hypothetical protein
MIESCGFEKSNQFRDSSGQRSVALDCIYLNVKLDERGFSFSPALRSSFLSVFVFVWL